MAAKKKSPRLSFINKEVDPVSESTAIGSAFTVLFFVLVKTFVVAVPLGIIIAFLHHRGVKRRNGK